MSTVEIFRDWWQSFGAVVATIAAGAPLWANKKKKRSQKKSARSVAVSILLGVVAVSLVLWQMSAREATSSKKESGQAMGTSISAKKKQQITISGSNSGVVQQISGPVGGSVLNQGSTQNISNTTNINDPRSQSPTLNSNVISNSGTLNIGAQSNSGNTENNSRNQINSGSGDVTLGEKISGDGSGNKISNSSGKVIVNGADNSLNIAGANSGVVVQGNSNTTIINIWMNTSEYRFPSNGAFLFPTNVSGKMAELKALSQTEEFNQAMKPFVALGTLQPERAGSVIRLGVDKSGSTAKPISYRRLYEIGALQSGTKSQEYLVKMAVSKDAMRPRWPMRSYAANTWIQNPEQTTLVHNAQKFINTYHEEMIQLGMLSE